MDISKVIELYGFTGVPEGEFTYTARDISAEAVQRLQDLYGIFDNDRLAYTKQWADRVAENIEAKSAFSWISLLLEKRVDCEHIKVTKKIDDKLFEMAAYLALLVHLPEAVELMRSRGIEDGMINESILTAFSNGLKAEGDGFFYDVLKLFSWSQLYIDAKLLRVGILNFELRDRVKDDCGGRLSPDDPVINVHIPAGIRLTPENCAHAYSECARIVSSAFPEFKFKAFVCFSWMMDAQLKDMLSPESNILKFQSRYETFFRNKPTDGVMMFVFGYPAGVKPHPSELSEDTSLRRAIKAHLLAGGQMYADGGIFFDY